MGHANLENLSELFVRRLYANGRLSIAECTEVAVEKGETLHASEGELEEECMISFGFEEVVQFLLLQHSECVCLRCGQKTPVIVPVDLTEEQSSVLEAWKEGTRDLECGDDDGLTTITGMEIAG